MAAVCNFGGILSLAIGIGNWGCDSYIGVQINAIFTAVSSSMLLQATRRVILLSFYA
jgi:hypothetical protein